METQGLDRVVIAVKDLDKAAKRYSEVLGASFWDAGPQEEQGVRAMVSWDGQVELISPISPQSAAAKFLERKGEGVIGVAWKVKDIAEAGDQATKKGFRIVDRFDFPAAPGFKLFKEILLHPKDTNEVTVILVQSERE
jgi:methylmalonyl-CoA/ethylmalonyl-CoA epimerase